MVDDASQVRQLEAEVVALKAELERSGRRVEAMKQIGRALGSSLETKHLLSEIMGRTTDLLEADRSTLFLVDADKRELWSTVLEGDELREIRLPMGVGIAGSVAESEQFKNVEDAYSDPDFHSDFDLHSGYRTRGVLAGPVRAPRGQEVIGVVQALNKKGGSFDAADEHLLEAIAAEIGVVLEAARLHKEALERSAKVEQTRRLTAIGQMLSGITHDFRTPMTLIQGHSELMVEVTDRDKRLEHAQRVKKQIDSMSSMIKGLLSFAKGERALLVRKVYLRSFMAEMKESLQPQCEAAQVELLWEVMYQGAAYFDETKIKRVFHNLIRNACEAMSEGGKLLVRVQADEAELQFRFTDEGPGIPPELEGRLFEPFATAQKVDGTGIGLAMVKQIVQEHQGAVDCEPQPQRGTSFVVRIPLGMGSS